MMIRRHPVILIPGFAGSKLFDMSVPPPPKFSKLKDTRTFQDISCPLDGEQKNKKRNGFINLNLFDSDWQDRYILKYDKVNKEFHLDDEIEVYDFGGIDGVQNLCDDCSQLDALFSTVFKREIISDLYNYKYFDDLISYLQENGWLTEETLFGAPYDFRKIVITEYLEKYMSDVKDLVEKAHFASKEKVVLVAHSIGCLLIYLMLVEYCSPAWKRKYIKSFVSIGGPYGGSSISLKTMLSGVPKLKLLKERYYNVMQHSSGLALALPNPFGFDSEDTLLQEKSFKRKYGIDNYLEALPEVSYNVWLKYVRPIIPSFLENTGVDTYIVSSTSTETDCGFVYDLIETNKIIDPIRSQKTMGDGIVPIKSLHMHQRLDLGYSNYFHIDLKDKNIEHTSILWNRQVFDLVSQQAIRYL